MSAGTIRDFFKPITPKSSAVQPSPKSSSHDIDRSHPRINQPSPSPHTAAVDSNACASKSAEHRRMTSAEETVPATNGGAVSPEVLSLSDTDDHSAALLSTGTTTQLQQPLSSSTAAHDTPTADVRHGDAEDNGGMEAGNSDGDDDVRLSMRQSKRRRLQVTSLFDSDSEEAAVTCNTASSSILCGDVSEMSAEIDSDKIIDSLVTANNDITMTSVDTASLPRSSMITPPCPHDTYSPALDSTYEFGRPNQNSSSLIGPTTADSDLDRLRLENDIHRAFTDNFEDDSGNVIMNTHTASQENIYMPTSNLSVVGKQQKFGRSSITGPSAKPSTSPADEKRREQLKASLLDTRVAHVSIYFESYVNFYFYWTNERPDLQYPFWMKPEFIKDSNGNRPFDEDYNVSTLYVPTPKSQEGKSEPRHFTPAMEAYWEIKRENFDKVVLFKLGRFYEIFYIDACISNKLCDLRWMGSDGRPHVGFPEVGLHTHAQRLVTAGFKVTVVEQMERPNELQARNRTSVGPKDKVVRRKICEVFTQGTTPHGEMLLSADARYLLSLSFASSEDVNAFVEADPAFGFAYVDTSTNQLYVGHSVEQPSKDKRQALLTLLAQVTPVEVTFDRKRLPIDVLSILRKIPAKPLLSPFESFHHDVNIEEEYCRYTNISHESRLPGDLDIRQRALTLCEEHLVTKIALAGLYRYLRSVLLDEQVAKLASYKTHEGTERTRMQMNHTTLRNLEIFYCYDGGVRNTLFAFLNRTATNAGHRLLKDWVASPLYRTADINERLAAVDWLINHPEIVGSITKRLKALPDFERSLSRINAQTLKADRGAVYFDLVPAKKIKQLIDLLDAFESVQTIMDLIKKAAEEDQLQGTQIASHLVCTGNNTVLPKLLAAACNDTDAVCILDATKDVKSAVTFDEESQVWQPEPGKDPSYDLVRDEMECTKEELERERMNIVKAFNFKSSELRFSNSKFKYEIEVSEERMSSKLQKEVDITSSKKGVLRFQTPEIKRLVEVFEVGEQKAADALYPFIQQLFKRVATNHHTTFATATKIVGFIDALISLALVSTNSGGLQMCRPEIMDPADINNQPTLLLEQSHHPVVAPLTTNFIPNDIELATAKVPAQFLLVTGPNMGGKSTVLRQTCVAVIMSQIGCYAPASRCVLTPVDKLFTRIGARDAILEAKSTLMVELEETAELLHQATKHSLCVLDELGRGTSTFDGTAIALATAEAIADRMCRCLFSTHYHQLCEELQDLKTIANFHMSTAVDEKAATVTFLYRFLSGRAPKSHGTYVAKLAGIQDSIIKLATEKALSFVAGSVVVTG